MTKIHVINITLISVCTLSSGFDGACFLTHDLASTMLKLFAGVQAVLLDWKTELANS